MKQGLLGGIFWAFETIIIGLALGMTPFVSDEQSLFLAPFVSTFLHDAFSAVYLAVYNGVRGDLPAVWRVVKSKNCRYLALASAVGGPVGMTGYVLAVNYMGASVGAVASAVYPAIGSLLAVIFLKEKIRPYQWIFLICTLLGVFGLSYSPELQVTDFRLGLIGAFMCAFGWGTEGVILSKCLKDAQIRSEYALQIRQSVSAFVYGVLVLPLLKGSSLTLRLFEKGNLLTLGTIAAAAFCATVSYLFYYTAIAKVGVAKAMGLNITYTAWAIIFGVVLFRNYAILNVGTVLCSAVVVVCGILSAVDFKQLWSVGKS